MPQDEERTQPDAPAPSSPQEDAPDQSAADFHGESLVGEALRSCVGPDCYTVHELEVGSGRVDHIEVNPGGLFEIESAAYEGSQADEDDARPPAAPSDETDAS